MTAATETLASRHRSIAPVPRRRHPLIVRGVLAAGFVVVLIMWWTGTSALLSSPAHLATTMGELSGMVSGYLVCAQLLLVARVPWFENAVGMDKLVAWHRILGVSVVLLIAVHVGLMILGGMLLDSATPWNEVLVIVSSYPDMLAALIGTAVFFAVGVSSAKLMRKYLNYEAWYWLHVTIYVAIFLTFLHQLSAGSDFIGNPVNRAVLQAAAALR